MMPGWLVLAVLILPPAESPPVPPERPAVAAVPSPGNPVDLRVETIQVGSFGTETLHAEEARILPGQGAVVEREITLGGRMAGGAIARETLRLRAEVRLLSIASSRAILGLTSRLRVLASSGGGSLPRDDVTREATAEVGEGASHLFEVYESPSLGTKLTLNIRWAAPEIDAAADPATVPMPMTIRLYDPEDPSGGLLSENRLLARLGGGASTSFNRTLPLPDTPIGERRVRQESLEFTVSPRFQGGRILEVTVEAVGVIATLEPGKRIPHSLSHRGRYVLSPGTPATLDLEVAANPSGEEGWSRVRYRLEILATF
jgi:hypothetical protein